MSTVAAKPIVRACTTAREIREQALEPALNIVATTDRERYLLALVYASLTDRHAREACRELASLVGVREKDAKTIAAFVDAAHARLEHAERYGNYSKVPVPSEGTGGRALAARASEHLRVMANAPAADRARARRELHAMFGETGEELLSKRVRDRMKASQALALRGEFHRWQALVSEVGAA